MAGAATAEPARPMPAAVRNSRRFNSRFIGVLPLCLSTKGARKRDDDPPFADNAKDATPQRTRRKRKASLLQRTLAVRSGWAAVHTTGERPPSTLVAVPVM